MNRRLALKSEHLSVLSTGELSAVAGGAVTTGSLTGAYPTLPVEGCVVVGEIPSWDCFTGTSAHTAVC